MFEATLAEGGILKKVLEAIKELLNEASFDCSDAGLQLQAMDTSHVSLVNLNLRCNGFEKFRCDRNRTMGMNLASLVKVLKCSNNDDAVTIRAPDNPTNIVTFVFESKKGDRVSEFDMKLMNLDHEHLGIPERDYECVITMPSGDFAKIVHDLGSFGESIVIACNKQGVKFSATGDVGTGNIKLAQSNSAVDIDLQEPVTLRFASSYLNKFAKAAGLSDKVTLSMSPDAPLVVQFKVASQKKDYGYIRYYLAPKFEDEED